MAKKKGFFRNPTLIILCAIVVVLFALFVAIGYDDGRAATLPENAANTVFAPLQRLFYSFGNGISRVFSPKEDTSAAALRELNARIAELESENLRLSETEAENERLYELLEYKNANPDRQYKAAAVTGKNDGIWLSSITINIGSDDGVHVDDPVITGKGVVGRVMETGKNWSRVVTLADGKSAISGLVERTRDNGVVTGGILSGEQEGTCRMLYLPADSELMPGDSVITSGLGGIYPKGLMIGTVQQVHRGAGGSDMYATVQPAVDFLHIEEVLVILSEDTQEGGDE